MEVTQQRATGDQRNVAEVGTRRATREVKQGSEVASEGPAPPGEAAQLRRQSAADASPGVRQLSRFDEQLNEAPNRTGLPDALKAGAEDLSGLSLDDVRVRYGSPRPAQLRAAAFAQGSEIHLGPGQEEHLPHETWHVVQQKQGRVPATMRLGGTAINDDPALEAEADRLGAAAQRQGNQGVVPMARTHRAASAPVVQGVFELWGWNTQNPTEQQVNDAFADVRERLQTFGFAERENTLVWELGALVDRVGQLINVPSHLTLNRPDVRTSVRASVVAGRTLDEAVAAIRNVPYHVTAEVADDVYGPNNPRWRSQAQSWTGPQAHELQGGQAAVQEAAEIMGQIQ